jgi:hypothetical protein
MTLPKIKPEHMAIWKAMEILKIRMKQDQKTYAEFAALLPKAHKSRLNKKDKYIVNPYTGKKEYYS